MSRISLDNVEDAIWKDVVWHEENPDNTLSEDYQKGFVRGLIQVTIIIKQLRKRAKSVVVAGAVGAKIGHEPTIQIDEVYQRSEGAADDTLFSGSVSEPLEDFEKKWIAAVVRAMAEEEDAEIMREKD